MITILQLSRRQEQAQERALPARRLLKQALRPEMTALPKQALKQALKQVLRLNLRLVRKQGPRLRQALPLVR
jgi:hypothetical protein